MAPTMARLYTPVTALHVSGLSGRICCKTSASPPTLLATRGKPLTSSKPRPNWCPENGSSSDHSCPKAVTVAMSMVRLTKRLNDSTSDSAHNELVNYLMTFSVYRFVNWLIGSTTEVGHFNVNRSNWSKRILVQFFRRPVKVKRSYDKLIFTV